jgi:transcriptional regulator with XRE-family HTH domain
MTDDKASIERTAARLRKARQSKKLTQAEVAKKAGVNENHYAQIERGEKNPTLSTFTNIIEAIGVSSTEILGK